MEALGCNMPGQPYINCGYLEGVVSMASCWNVVNVIDQPQEREGVGFHRIWLLLIPDLFLCLNSRRSLNIFMLHFILVTSKTYNGVTSDESFPWVNDFKCIMIYLINHVRIYYRCVAMYLLRFSQSFSVIINHSLKSTIIAFVCMLMQKTANKGFLTPYATEVDISSNAPGLGLFRINQSWSPSGYSETYHSMVNCNIIFYGVMKVEAGFNLELKRRPLSHPPQARFVVSCFWRHKTYIKTRLYGAFVSSVLGCMDTTTWYVQFPYHFQKTLGLKAKDLT